MNRSIYHVGICSICHQGVLGIRICGGCQAAMVICDECEALWTGPSCQGRPIFPTQGGAPCPICAASLYQGHAHWADAREIEQLGWTGFTQGESGATDSAHPDSTEEKRRDSDGSV